MKRSLFLSLLLPVICFSQNGWNMNLIGSLSYPNTKCNDIWGWEDGNGNEYALVGLENGFSCVDVTNPSVPVEMFFISDNASIWRDVKTWGNYAYITTDITAHVGLLIVDLTDMTGSTFWHVTNFINPNTNDSVEFKIAHNLYIDENGIAYIFGASSNTPGSNPSNGAIFLDINSNPTNPVYLGEWDDEYIHDGMVRGDTMYAGCIYAGKLFIVDVSDKSNPQTIGHHVTPNQFTHNAWVSDNGEYVFTTDEQSDAYLAAYDITNLNNIQEVDRIQSNPGSNSIPHNTFVDGNFLITSYYRDGTTVHDITYPNHMIQVAYYDSYTGSGNGFNGCWGTYPYLSSGNIISSDRDSYNDSVTTAKGELNIYGRSFQQACYLMGNLTDGINSNNIDSAYIRILNTTTTASTNIIGDYQTAVVDSGTYEVVFSKTGYISDTLLTFLNNGIMTILNNQLFLLGSGCTDSTVCNYNLLATIDDGSCSGLLGCTDSTACNYNSSATCDDGSCLTVFGCTDSTALNYNIFSSCNDGSCIYLASDLFISEYAEGSGYNKYIEIYNGTGSPVNLSTYQIWKITNGGNWPEDTLNLNGILAHDDIYIIYHSNADSLIVLAGDITWTQANWNGNDAVGLAKNGILIDALGSDGPNPGSGGWDVAGITNATKDHTLVRKCSVIIGDTNWVLSAGSDSISSQWLVLLQNDWMDLGNHTYPCSGATIYGCMDSLALNYNPFATIDDSSCVYCLYGCMDSIACNYDSIATCDNGSCVLPDGCTDSLACNYDATALCDDRSCVYNPTIQIFQNILDLEAIVNGGISPYAYHWNTNAITQMITPSTNGLYWCLVTDNNGCVSDTATFNVTNITTLLSDLAINNLLIYPNPTDALVNIKFNINITQNIKLKLSNTIGQKLFINHLENFKGEYSKQISLKGYTKAIYLLEIETDNGIINKKFILQ